MGAKEQRELELYTNDRLWLSLGLLLAGVVGWVGVYYLVQLVMWLWRIGAEWLS